MSYCVMMNNRCVALCLSYVQAKEYIRKHGLLKAYIEASDSLG